MIHVWKVKRLKPPPWFSVGVFCLFVYLFVFMGFSWLDVSVSSDTSTLSSVYQHGYPLLLGLFSLKLSEALPKWNNHSNPTQKMYSPQLLHRLIEIRVRYGLWGRSASPFENASHCPLEEVTY